VKNGIVILMKEKKKKTMNYYRLIVAITLNNISSNKIEMIHSNRDRCIGTECEMFSMVETKDTSLLVE
jgi:hypothetical protein